MNIALGPFAPDQSPFDGNFLRVCNNVVPVPGGYGPFQSLAAISTALGSECRGAAYSRTADGTTRIVAGTTTGLFEYDGVTGGWTDISGPDAPYNVPIGDNWTFTEYGDQLIIHNIADPIQKYSISSGGTVASLGGTPPRAKYSWVAGDFLVLGHLDGGLSSMRTVQWCAVNNPEEWTIGRGGADLQELPEGDEIVGGVGEPGGFTVIQRSGIQYFPFAPGSGFTFTRQVLNPKQGCVAPLSIVAIGPGMYFYLSEDGFFGGPDRKPIGAQRVDNWFLTEAKARLSEVQGAADPTRKIVWWRYLCADNCYKLLGYHWQHDRWITCDANVSQLVSMTTPTMTWDGLDNLYASIDDVDEAFDSRVFDGASTVMAGFTSDNKLGLFNGPSLEATFQTASMELDETSRTFIGDVRVITDASEFWVKDGRMSFHDDTLVWSNEQAPHARTRLCHFRQDARLHKLALRIGDDQTWTIASGMRVNAQVVGSV